MRYIVAMAMVLCACRVTYGCTEPKSPTVTTGDASANDCVAACNRLDELECQPDPGTCPQTLADIQNSGAIHTAAGRFTCAALAAATTPTQATAAGVNCP